MNDRPVLKPPTRLCAHHRTLWTMLCRRDRAFLANFVVNVCRRGVSPRCSWRHESDR